MRTTCSRLHTNIHWNVFRDSHTLALSACHNWIWLVCKQIRQKTPTLILVSDTHTHRYWQIPTGSMCSADEEPCSERPVDFSSLHWLTTRQYPTTLLCRTYTWDCSFMFFQHLRLEGQPAHQPTKHLSTKTSEWWKAENRQRCLALPRVYSVGVSINVLPPSSRSTRRGDSFWWQTMDVRML